MQSPLPRRPPQRGHARVLTRVSGPLRAEEGGAAKMLEDPLMQTATAEILVGDRPRYEIQRDIKAKVRSACRMPMHAVCCAKHYAPQAKATPYEVGPAPITCCSGNKGSGL